MTARALISIAALCACRGSEPTPAPPPDPPVQRLDASSVPPDAAGPRLAPDREAFWAKLIGAEPGQRGPDLVAWCTAPFSAKATEGRNLSPTLWLERRTEDDCAVVAGGSQPPDAVDPLVIELDTVLSRWGAPAPLRWEDVREHTWVDRRARLTAGVWRERVPLNGGPAERIAVHWFPYLELDAVLGEPDHLVRGIDLERLVGLPPTQLRRAVRPPFKLGSCAADMCTATALPPPGASAHTQLQSFVMGGQQGVSLDIYFPYADQARAIALIETSLGRTLDPTATAAANPHGGTELRVYRRGAIRYTIKIGTDRLGVVLTPDR